MKRNLRYFAKQKVLQAKVNKLREMHIDLQTPADFPDSGYYYQGKQREMDRLYEKICPFGEQRDWGYKEGEFRVTPARWKRLWALWENLANEVYHEYYEVVRAVTIDGRELTSSDMDAMMVYH